jgi:hypothetical protein
MMGSAQEIAHRKSVNPRNYVNHVDNKRCTIFRLAATTVVASSHKVKSPVPSPKTTVIAVCGTMLPILLYIVLSRYHRHSVAPHTAITTIAVCGATLPIDDGLRLESQNGSTLVASRHIPL